MHRKATGSDLQSLRVALTVQHRPDDQMSSNSSSNSKSEIILDERMLMLDNHSCIPNHEKGLTREQKGMRGMLDHENHRFKERKESIYSKRNNGESHHSDSSSNNGDGSQSATRMMLADIFSSIGESELRE